MWGWCALCVPDSSCDHARFIPLPVKIHGFLSTLACLAASLSQGLKQTERIGGDECAPIVFRKRSSSRAVYAQYNSTNLHAQMALPWLWPQGMTPAALAYPWVTVVSGSQREWAGGLTLSARVCGCVQRGGASEAKCCRFFSSSQMSNSKLVLN